MNCPFCESNEIIISNENAYARYDKFPVSKGHVLIIPFRHVMNYFDLNQEEQTAIIDLLNLMKIQLDNDFNPNGYNIGMNVGEDAGQTVNHVHCHLIPRYKGDVTDPRGGVRGVIPDKKLY